MHVLFHYVCYPAMILLILGALALGIIGVLFSANTGRRFVAALLPVFCFVFWIAARPADQVLVISNWLSAFPFWLQLGIGIGAGFLAMLLTQMGIRSAIEIGAVLAVIILSTLACVVTLFLFDGVLATLWAFLLGLILGLGLFVILLGFPGGKPAARPR